MPNFPCFIEGSNIDCPTIIFNGVKDCQEMIFFPALEPVLITVTNEFVSLELGNIYNKDDNNASYNT